MSRETVTRYRFLTTWLLDAPLDHVWHALYDTERWPEWWRGVRRVEKLRGGDERGVGAVFRHHWRSALPYTVRFDVEVTRVECPHLLEGAARGELAGEGRWRLWDDGAGVTAVTYEWNVDTTRPWMNAVARLGRPVFGWNHDYVMRGGGDGLARLLGAHLLARS